MRPRRILASALTALVLAGCHRAKVETYQVPKEKDPELPPGMNAAGAAPEAGPMAANSGGSGMAGNVPTASGPSLSWTAPSDWKALPASGMRKGSYTISGAEGHAELSITAFPGDVGGELANVNRWRGQAGLPPLSADALDQNVDRVKVNGLSATVVDLGDRTSPARILGAIVPFGDGVWFFKLTGPGPLLERVKPEFQKFVRSIEPPPNA